MRVFVVALIASIVLAENGRAGPEAWLQTGLLTPDLIVSLKAELGLTAEQESKMTDIVTEASSGATAMEQALHEQQQAFNRLLKRPETTVDEASAALSRLLEAEAPMKQLQLRTLLQLRDLLTPEQQKKAVKMAPVREAKRTEVEARVREKARQLKSAVDALGVPATEAMKERGDEIETLIKVGELMAADKTLDQLVVDSGLHDLSSPEVPDFGKYEAGDTDLDALKQRYEDVLTSAQRVVSLPLIRKLLQAKDALEQAKAAEDAAQVGRILTWAEATLEKK